MEGKTMTIALFDASMDDEYPSDSARYIITKLIPEWTDLFLEKNVDYGDDANRNGLIGQFCDLDRKMIKLRRAWMDNKALVGEQPREIAMDLIGHCFLAIKMLDEMEQK